MKCQKCKAELTNKDAKQCQLCNAIENAKEVREYLDMVD